jgi:hypothetical protein
MNRMMSPSAPLHLVEHALQPLLELAAIFGARDQAAHVERHQLAVLQRVGHVAIGDAQREPFGDRGLAHAGFADQHGIVLGTPRQDLDGATDLLVAADHRIELAVARRLGEVAGEFLERVVAILGARRVGGAPAAQLVDRGVQPFGLHARRGSALPAAVVVDSASASSSRSTVTKLSPALVRDLLGLVEVRDQVIVEPRRLLRAAARNGGDLGQRRVGLAQRGGVAAGGLDQAGRHALLVLEQRLQQMLGLIR